MNEQENVTKVKKPIWKKWWFWLLVVAVAFAFIGGGEETKSVSTNSSSTETKSEQSEATIYSLNQEVKIENLSFLASETKTAQKIGNEFVNKKTEGAFLLVKIKITNNDKEARTIDTNLFKLKDANGTEYSAMADADMYINEDSSFFLEQVNPGLSRSGYIVFEVPKEIKGAILEVSSGLGWSGGEYAQIKLN